MLEESARELFFSLVLKQVTHAFRSIKSKFNSYEYP